MCSCEKRLTTETVQSAALSLEGIDDIEGGDGLALGVLGVGDCIADDAFEEGLEDTAGFFVDHWGGNALVMLCLEEGRGQGTYWLRYA